jgi:hypothetical protein
MYDLIGDPSNFEDDQGQETAGKQPSVVFLNGMRIKAWGAKVEEHAEAEEQRCVGVEGEGESTTATPYLALEWLDLTLQDIEPRLDRNGYILITAVIQTIMSSILALDEAGLANTGECIFRFLQHWI